MVGDKPEPKLTVELVPRTCWFSNVRSEVSPDDWDRLKKQTAAAAGRRCEVCGGRGPKWPVECHEVWDYDITTKVQKLERLIALCPACHEVKHIGYAQLKGRLQPALTHLAAVNGWSVEDALHYVEWVFEVWADRSQFEWKLDLSFLDGLGVAYTTRR